MRRSGTTTSSVALRIVLLALVAVLGAGAYAYAASPSAGGGGGHGDTAAHGGACFDDHWSVFDEVAPAFRENVCGMLGQGFIEGKPVSRGFHILMAVLVALVSLGFAFAARGALTRKETAVVPETKLSFRTFFELVIEAVLNLMIDVMGEKKARQFLPLIGALAIFIFFSNLAGSIPGFLPPTDNLNTTFALGGVVFVMTHVAGLREHGIGYVKHFLGPIIKWYALPLMIVMAFIEIISHLVRPCSLAVRLMGNIFGDHTVLGIFLGFHILFVPLPIMVLGLLVCVVQTLVFCLLSIVYIALAVEHAEEGH